MSFLHLHDKADMLQGEAVRQKRKKEIPHLIKQGNEDLYGSFSVP